MVRKSSVNEDKFGLGLEGCLRSDTQEVWDRALWPARCTVRPGGGNTQGVFWGTMAGPVQLKKRNFLLI